MSVIGETTSTVEYIPSDIAHEEEPEVTLPVPIVGDEVNAAVNENLPQGWIQTTFDPMEAPVTIVTYIWILGILGMLGYGIVSYFRLRQKLVGAICLRDNIYLADHIRSPFVMGILHPRIYLPSDIDEREQGHIILHEKQHIKRGDHVLKLLAYLALCIHWFNPLVWAAFHMSAKDMEMSCDEAVVRKLGEEIRADYSASLLQLATGQKSLFGAPLAFGEGEPSGRIRNLAHFKRPTVRITLIGVLVCMAGILLCVFNPVTSSDSQKMMVIRAVFQEEALEGMEEASLEANPDEVSDWITEEINVETRDVTHDGVADYIVTSMSYDSSYVDVNASLQDRIAQQIMYDVISVKVYEGQSDSGTYREDDLLWSREYSRVHVGNGQLSIVQVDGKDYMLTSSLYGNQGFATWDYEVFSLKETGEETVIDKQSVEFQIGAENAAESYGAFQAALDNYAEHGILIVACDIDFEKQLIRTQESPYLAQDYYEYAFTKFNESEPQPEEQGVQETDREGI